MFENIKRAIKKQIWKSQHPNSQMIPVNRFDFKKVHVGNYSYGELKVIDFGGDCNLIIKNFVSVAQDVTFILNGEHHIKTMSTYPFKVKMIGTETEESFGKGDIVVDDDVWIGYGAKILSGVHIGQGAVIAAGALVVRDVPPYAIVGGSPSKIISYRFKENTINKLLHCDFSKLTKDMVIEHVDELYSEVNEDSNFDWFPKK